VPVGRDLGTRASPRYADGAVGGLSRLQWQSGLVVQHDERQDNNKDNEDLCDVSWCPSGVGPHVGAWWVGA
jgi:hypothetical protein